MTGVPHGDAQRRILRLKGAVQGVGFRPHVYRLAHEEGLAGLVRNDRHGVHIDVEGAPVRLDRFTQRLVAEAPSLACVTVCESRLARPAGRTRFAIGESETSSASAADITPDAAMCQDCRAEIFDPANRRHRYAFTNCTQCGPRYSVVTGTPYDRASTTMAAFRMCPACAREYADPGDRRFHAQPNACPACGPHLDLLGRDGRHLASADSALRASVAALADGKILAVKGLGGFHLICDARNWQAVTALRTRKHRPRKPFAVMVPDLTDARGLCEVSAGEAALLSSPAAPITLLRRRTDTQISDAVAPGNPWLGVMLAYTPLHALLLNDFGGPVVATSGNRGGAPLVTTTAEALDQLADISDLVLTHNRPIASGIDDSLVRIAASRPMLLRRARGYVPKPHPLPAAQQPLVALGGQLKTTVGAAGAGQAQLSAHIGDLDDSATHHAFQTAVTRALMSAGSGAVIACDLHPDYASTQAAGRLCERPIKIQHHLAHIHAVLAEHQVEEPVLGIAFDGAGHGMDATSWGGEALLVDGAQWRRFGHLRRFRLPGGDAAAREPARCAIGLLHAGSLSFDTQILKWLALDRIRAGQLKTLCARGLASPQTSSVGRLFDGVAALLGLCHFNTFEGEAAMAVESAAEPPEPEAPVPPVHLCRREEDELEADWVPLIAAILAGRRAGMARAPLAGLLHSWLASMTVALAERAGRQTVVLGGGCFQNRLLLETTVARLRAQGFAPLWPQQYPCNDGGLALGQLHAAALMAKAETGEAA